MAIAASPEIVEPAQAFGIAERTACQQILEELDSSYRLWPEHNPGTKPRYGKPRDDSWIAAKAETSLRMESALASLYGVRFSERSLQNEISRMAQYSKAPDRLQERFDALKNDPLAVAECIARPALVSKALRAAYARDPHWHDALKARALATLNDIDDTAALSQSGATQFTVSYRVEKAGTETPDSSSNGIGKHAANTSVTVSGEELMNIRSGLKSTERRSGAHLVLKESDQAFFIEVIELDAADQLDVRRVVWKKRGFMTWWEEQAEKWSIAQPSSSKAKLSLPQIEAQSTKALTSVGGTWRTEAYPEQRSGHTAVWTGSEMLVWGGEQHRSLSSGSRYDPTTDSWSFMSTANEPTARHGHSAVWTGDEMLIWGGSLDNGLASVGGRYDPASDTWLAMAVDGEPSPRHEHSAIWTGSVLIIWGGADVYPTDTGGRYDPASDTWTPTAINEIATARRAHSAVWDGSEMLVWGGNNFGGDSLGGARYDPLTNAWSAMSGDNQPTPRSLHTAVWTGSEMIVWGWQEHNHDPDDSGGRYNPVTDTWTGISTAGLPSGRLGHTAVWTGDELIVWGGKSVGEQYFNSGGRYKPSNDTWTATSTSGAPNPRADHSAVWTGNELIVWGGSPLDTISSGGRYDPVTNSWLAITSSGAPEGRDYHSSIWTGNEMIVWGGGFLQADGGRYEPSTDTWVPTSDLQSPAGRRGHSAVWSGTEMIVWGGSDFFFGFQTGGRYDPAVDSWSPTSTSGAPVARGYHTAVWTGQHMLVWGGVAFLSTFGDGGRYDPVSNSWISISSQGAPSARHAHTAVWTGTEMIVWGGNQGNNQSIEGGRYIPSNDAWSATSTTGAPTARNGHTAVWTGSEMIIWGGDSWSSGALSSGARYSPVHNSWTPTAPGNSPTPRRHHSAVWTGDEMIVWGGQTIINGQTIELATGGRYSQQSDSWRQTALHGAPIPRSRHTAVWTSNEMLVWGGVPSNMGVYFPPDSLPATAITTMVIAPSPSVLNETVSISVDVQGTGSAPLDGQVLVRADDGQTCVAWMSTSEGNTARFTCQLNFYSIGERQLTAAFGGSSSHDDSDNLSDPVPHGVRYGRFHIQGTVTGLPSGASVVLQNNGGDDLQITGNGAFSFTLPVLSDEGYDVLVSTQPEHPLSCRVYNGSGTVESYDVNNVLVKCGIQSVTEISEHEGPVRAGVAVEYLVAVTGLSGAPVDGSVTIRRNGETACWDFDIDSTVGNTVHFSCSVFFLAPGQYNITATYQDSEHHIDSDSEPVAQAVIRVADISVSVDDGRVELWPGMVATYLIELRNAGPDEAPNTMIATEIHPALLDLNWMCTALGTSTCPAQAGSGPISHSVDLAAGGGLDYTLQGVVDFSAFDRTVLNVQAAVDEQEPSYVIDPALGNNAVTDINTNVWIFSDQFEP